MHPCTIQKHQALDDRWPGLLLQTAFYRCCETTRVHFMVLRGINRTAWGTRLLLTPVLASFVDCVSLCHTLKAQHCSLSLNGCFNPPSASHPPPPFPHPPPARPPPINSIRDITGTEINHLKNQQHSSSLYKLIAKKLHCSYQIPDVTVLCHKRSTVHSIFQISISRNTICAEMVDFRIPGHI